jgi:hypothetical protein
MRERFAREHNGSAAIKANAWPAFITYTPKHADVSRCLGMKELQVLRDSPREFPIASDDAVFSAGNDQVEQLGHEGILFVLFLLFLLVLRP